VSAGDPLGSGGLVWAQAEALGVNAEVELKNDMTFTLTGSLPQSNDTLGYTPSILTLNDQGTWTYNEDVPSLEIAGALYTLGGMLTMDDPDAPMDISMTYQEVDTIPVVLPVDTDGDGEDDLWLADIEVIETGTTTLGFVK
jgi:hypothetical protein